MSNKITISVPPDLSERLSKFKGKICISKVCQNGLERNVEMFESMMATGSEMEKTITRLKIQKKSRMAGSFDRGQSEGAKNIHKMDLDEILSIHDTFNRTGKYKQPDGYNSAELCLFSQPVVDEECFLNGFACGVSNAWDMIKHKI